ncbi:MAG: thiamine diphosphokinase [Clostridia bacterium]|nr:thiamine diphosphokinase [Clostridia bacterium]
MEQRICHVVGAGPFCQKGPSPGPGDLVIAADGGYEHLRRWGMVPDVVIGDFDSMAAPAHPVLIRLPREKDETDMAAAVGVGRERGYTVFHLYGGLGALLDHTLANLQLLVGLARAGAQGFLFDDQIIATAIADASFTLPPGTRGRVSVFAYGGTARGVFLRGLKYPLTDATLTDGFPLGVSNEALGGAACVAVREGTLLLLYPRA